MALPGEVRACCRLWIVQEPEPGRMVVFRERDGMSGCAQRFAFVRDDGAWSVQNLSTIREHEQPFADVGMILQLYRICEAEYGGPIGGTLGADGRPRGPYGTKATGWDGRQLERSNAE